ncbi:4-hydroxy-3-methylbut-2-enyl diphosphate reductase [Bacteroidota bacterium]
MIVEIDENSGFCFGVVRVIQMAEEELEMNSSLFCLGDIVHNNLEVERLKNKGLIIINFKEYKQLKNCKVLLRAHGEPPEVYEIAKKNNITLIDASCPVVLRLQQKIKTGFKKSRKSLGQIVIFGKDGHAEVNGLVGQTCGKAIVVGKISDLDKIDYNLPIHLYAQTTQSKSAFSDILDEIKKRSNNITQSKYPVILANDTICKQVSNRAINLKTFAINLELIIFVSSKESSNGKILFEACRVENPNSKFISDPEEIDEKWLKNINSVGICGATSTPMWLMELVKQKIEKMNI